MPKGTHQEKGRINPKGVTQKQSRFLESQGKQGNPLGNQLPMEKETKSPLQPTRVFLIISTSTIWE
jgi:hypothetical protein